MLQCNREQWHVLHGLAASNTVDMQSSCYIAIMIWGQEALSRDVKTAPGGWHDSRQALNNRPMPTNATFREEIYVYHTATRADKSSSECPHGKDDLKNHIRPVINQSLIKS